MEDRYARLGAATGIVTVILVVIAFAIAPEAPDADASAREVAKYFSEEQDGIRHTMVLFSAVFFFYLWFLGTLRSYLRVAEGGTGRLSGTAFGGGLIGGAFFLLIITCVATAAFRPDETPPETIRVLNDMSLLAGAPAMAGFTVLFAAAGAVILRYGGLPAGIGWFALLTALAQPLALGSIFEDSGAWAADGILGFAIPLVTFLAWILVTSVAMVRTPLSAGPAGPAGPATPGVPERPPGP